MTTSSLSYTNKLAQAGAREISDQDIIKEYDLDPSLRGEDLDKAAEAIQRQRNKEWTDRFGQF